MHIAFLTPEYPHNKVLHAAGIGTSIKNLASGLVKKDVAVSVFVYGQNTGEVFIENNITIHLIKNKKYLFGKWFFYRKYIQNYVSKVIKREKINIIEAPDWTGITAFMSLVIPLVIRFHGSDAYFCHLENRKQKLKNYWFEKLSIHKAVAYIAPTQFAGELTAQIFNIRNKQIKIIHQGVELNKFNNSNPEKFEKGLILYIGTIIKKKGVLEIPQIFNNVIREIPTAKLILIGSDSFDIETQSKSTWDLMQPKFEKKAMEHVSYLGKLSYNEIQSYITKAQVCIFPSFAETFGMVTIEAMSLGKPVVSSNFGWANELIVDGYSGFLVHPKDHIGFSNKIVELMNNKKLHSNISKNACNRIKDIFDIDKISNENIIFYKSIIEK